MRLASRENVGKAFRGLSKVNCLQPVPAGVAIQIWPLRTKASREPSGALGLQRHLR